MFVSGFEGGVYAVAKTRARETAAKMLGGTLVTK